VFAHQMTVNYREAHGIHACCGILFNHESPRRGENFVTRKVTRGVARVLADPGSKLQLGHLDARRDWGHARDYVRAMWLMLQEDEPGDYVVATGRTHSVGDLVELAFGMVGLDWRDHVLQDPSAMRPADIEELRGDAGRAARRLGWTPTIGFGDMIWEMLEADIWATGMDPRRYLQAEAFPI
jgi:GDPmannose 4,6-dehydratase